MQKLNPEYICNQPERHKPTTIPPLNYRGKSIQLTGCKSEKGSTVALMATSTTFNPIEYLMDNLVNMPEQDTASQKKFYELIQKCHKVYKERLRSRNMEEGYNMEIQPIGDHNETELRNFLAPSHSSPVDDKLENYVSLSSSSRELIRSPSKIYFSAERYKKEFEEIRLIAEGGFGAVYLAKNIIDDCLYAVKKICLRYRNSKEFFRSLEEARTLAKLDHRNVVPYKAAWLEPCTISSREESLASSSFSPGFIDSDSERMKIEDDIKDGTGGPELSIKPSTSSKFNLLESMSHDLKDDDNDVPSKKSSLVCIDLPLRKDIHCDPKESSKEYLDQKSQLHDSCQHAMLFIKMQLCKENLRNWLDKRNEALKNSKNLDHIAVCEALYIFQEILNGMEYVHKEIIHHDLKPHNIFVDGIQYCPCDSENKGKVNGEVRIGDFGLACHYAHSSKSTEDDIKAVALNPANLSDKSSCIIEKGLHPSMTEKERFGTELYSAPEQLERCCNQKSDIYSLGIILFELFHPFTTYMERSKKIMALRNEGLFPEFFEQCHPLVASLIKKLTSKGVNDRPCITDVLKMFTNIVEFYENDASEGYDATLNRNNAIQKENETKYVKECSLRCIPGTSSGCYSQTCENVKKEQQVLLAELEEKNAGKDKEIARLVNQMGELRNYCLTLQSNSKHGWNISRKIKKEKEKKEEVIKELQVKVAKLESDCRKNKHVWSISNKLKKENLEKNNTIIKQNRQINHLKSLCREKDEDMSRMCTENANKDDSLNKLKLEMKPLKNSEHHKTGIYQKRKFYKNFRKDTPKVRWLHSDIENFTALSDLIYN